MRLHWTVFLSRLFYHLAQTRFPRPLQRWINRFYVRLFAIDMSPFPPVETYPSLQALFTRPLLTPPAVEADPTVIASPCDGVVSATGIIQGGMLWQIKGRHYPLHTLLPDPGQAQSLEGGTFITIYLAPSDYHRYHAPVDMEITTLHYQPGRLWPVNQKALNRIDRLFTVNERVTLTARCKDNPFVMTFVGALNVGRIRFVFDEAFPNAHSALPRQCAYDVSLSKGAELGRFEMGSTIVLFFPANTIRCGYEEGSHIRVGEELGRWI